MLQMMLIVYADFKFSGSGGTITGAVGINNRGLTMRNNTEISDCRTIRYD